MSQEHYFLATRLNSYVMAQKRNAVVLPDGTRDTVWVDAMDASIPAEVITIGGEEGRTAMMTSGETRYRITIRYRDDIDNAMRLRIDTDDSVPVDNRAIVDIKAPPRDPDGMRIMLEINGVRKEGAV